MVREQLYINGIEIPLSKSLNPNITKTINDISEPQKKQSDFSKTIKLPNSKVISKLFTFIFEINNDGTFNVNKKADALYLVDSETVLNGYLQLKNITVNDSNDIEYSCVLFGETANFFNDIKGLELDDIQNLDDFNHLNEGGVKLDSWDSQIKFQGANIPFQMGRGYVYPLINYGYDNSLDEYDTTELQPAFFTKELFDRIFKDSGYSYTSNFLSNNPRFVNTIIPFTSKEFSLTDNQIVNRIFKADTTSFNSLVTPLDNDSYNISKINFPNEIQDIGGVYNNANGQWVVANNGNYNINTSVELYAKFTPVGNTVDVKWRNNVLRAYVYVFRNGQILASKQMHVHPEADVWIPSGTSYGTEVNPTYPSLEYLHPISQTQHVQPNNTIINVNNVQLFIGDVITVEVRVKVASAGFTNAYHMFEDSSGNTYSQEINLETQNGYFKNAVVNSAVAYGDLIEMEQAVPRKVKQLDFILSLFKMYNLFVSQDPSNIKNLLIEPRDDYFNSDVVDWSMKLDQSKDLDIKPMGLLNASTYLFSYKKDSDYYNDSYMSNYGRVYGNKTIDIDNDFNKGENKTELIFSPTPIVGQSYNDRVVPTIIKADANGVVSRMQGNIRILVYGGLIPTNTQWLYGNIMLDKYPYCGHFDNPFNPTFDINFDLPKEIYYDATYNTISLIDDNLYNRFWKKHIEEITDVNSRLVEGYFYLTPGDISKLDFRKQYYFEGAYFRLQKVNNYNPSDVSLTKCTFLKLKNKDVFTSTTVVIGGASNPLGASFSPLINTTNNVQLGNNSYNSKSALVTGEDNLISHLAKSINIQGNNNVISDQCKNIVINGNNNTIVAGVENVQLINTSDVTVTESNTIYINGQGHNSSTYVSEGKSVSIGIANKYIEADTDSGLVELDLPNAIGNLFEFTFKNIGSGILTIYPVPTQTIDGLASLSSNTSYETITLYSNGINWLIK